MSKYPTWRSPKGTVIACEEKIKVMRENLDEIEVLTQEAFTDAVIMEVSEEQLRDVLHDIINRLKNPYKT